MTRRRHSPTPVEGEILCLTGATIGKYDYSQCKICWLWLNVPTWGDESVTPIRQTVDVSKLAARQPGGCGGCGGNLPYRVESTWPVAPPNN